jgi:hypothetical protein
MRSLHFVTSKADNTFQLSLASVVKNEIKLALDELFNKN